MTYTESIPVPTWHSMLAMEPALDRLLKDIRAVKPTGRDFCANEIWYRCFKPRLLKLVGWEARRPELRSMGAYDLAYETLYEELPACRRCSCVRLEEFGL